MSNYDGFTLLWFREFVPCEETINRLCENFKECKRVEFYCLSLNVCKLEKGVIFKPESLEDIYKLATILKSHVVVSSQCYNFEDRYLYSISRNKKFLWI